MDGELYRIGIQIDVQNHTEPQITQSERSLSRFERSVQRTQQTVTRLNRTPASVTVTANDRASAVIDKVGRGARAMAMAPVNLVVKAVDLATSPLRSLFNYATSLRGVLTGVVAGAGFNKLFMAPVGFADQMTTAEIGFETAMKSAAKAKRMMADIKEFAIRTPFETMDVINQSQRMMSMGWDPNLILRDMERIGNTAAATGKGALGMERIVLALGQIRMKGKLSAEELNQLTEAGVNARDYIAKGMGVTVPVAMKMAEKGLIDANAAVNMILTGMKQFDGQMDKTANRTVSGLGSQIKDAFTIGVVEKWGRGLQEGAIAGLSEFNGWVTTNRGQIGLWGNSLQTLGKQISMGAVKGVEMLAANSDKAFKELRKTEREAARMGDTLTAFDKFKILWDNIIGKPFDSWWKSTGEKKFQAAGRMLGASIAQGMADGMKTLLPAMMQDAMTGLPGGQQASSTSWLSTLALGYLGIKGAKGVGGLLKGGSKALSWMRGLKGAGAAAAETAAVATSAAPAAATTAARTIPIFGANGQVISTVTQGAAGAAEGAASGAARSAGLLSKFGGLAGIGTKMGKFGGGPLAALLGGGMALYHFSKGNKAQGWGDIGGTLGGIAGGALGGAAAGAAFGGVGAIPGMLIGGILGGLGGDKAAKMMYSGATKDSKVITNKQVAPTININVQTAPKFDIKAASSAEQILGVIQSNISKIADDVSHEVADSIAKIYSNTPLKGATT